MTMVEFPPVREWVRIFLLCMGWYAFSAGGNILNKMILNGFPHPVTISMSRMFFIIAFLPLVLRAWGLPKADLPHRCHYRNILPLAFGEYSIALLTHFTIWKVTVSYAHTVRATMPIWVVLISRIAMKEKQATAVYASLVPIVGGVLLASVSELSLDLSGLMCALATTLIRALQNVSFKKVLRDTGIHPLRLVHVLLRIAALFMVPTWLLVDLPIFLDQGGDLLWGLSDRGGTTAVLLLLLASCLCKLAEMVVAVVLLDLVSPLSYSVACASKGLVVISVSLLCLRNPVTYVNLLGVAMAAAGVCLYLKAMHNTSQKKLLPSTTQDLMS